MLYGKIMRLRRTHVNVTGLSRASSELSQADKERWDSRYLGGAYETRRRPSTLLVQWLERLEFSASERKALDLACGAGRNALYLARRGWQVDAVDISTVALERLGAAATAERLPVNCIHLDLDSAAMAVQGFSGQSYDLAVMMRYTDLALVRSLPPAVSMGGYVIVEKHMETEAVVAGPRNSRFRVATGALRRAADKFEVVHYHEGIVTDPDGRDVALAQLVGRRGEIE